MAVHSSNDNSMLLVRGLRKYFPVRRGFLQKVIGWVKAVDGVSFAIDRQDPWSGRKAVREINDRSLSRLLSLIKEPSDKGRDIAPLASE
jgi:hypothetical protein